MKAKSILLGYEVGLGEAVHIPLHHTIVTGVTQLSGKTTTLEAIITRGGDTSIAFKTKRGEANFAAASVHFHTPFFRERADWQYVQGVLEASMRERMKFERSWIIRVSKGAKTLRDVLDNVETELETAKGLSESVYTNLKAYLEIVVPEIESITFAKKLDLKPGLNVMDLTGLRDEVQALVIASTLEAVHEKAKKTKIVLPEAWKFIPEGRSTPVKYVLEKIARQGAAVEVFVYIDSQDVTGVDKTILKNVSVWILGRQNEKNEVERVLDQIPLPKKQRPMTHEVMSLDIGQFFVCYGSTVKKVYVRPAWITDKLAKHIAVTGQVHLATEMRPEVPEEEEEDMGLKEENAELKTKLKEMERKLAQAVDKIPSPKLAEKRKAEPQDSSSTRVHVKLDVPVPHMTVTERIVHLTATNDDDKGRVALLISEGYFDEPKAVAGVCRTFESRGWGKWNQGRGSAWDKMSRILIEFAEWGFLVRTGKDFVLVPDVKTRIKRVKERA